MRGTLIVMAVATGFAMAGPASADDYYIRGPGFGVGVDTDHYHPDRDRDYDRRYRTEGFDREYDVARCRTTIIRRDDGSVRKVRRCRD